MRSVRYEAPRRIIRNLQTQLSQENSQKVGIFARLQLIPTLT